MLRNRPLGPGRSARRPGGIPQLGRLCQLAAGAALLAVATGCSSNNSSNSTAAAATTTTETTTTEATSSTATPAPEVPSSAPAVDSAPGTVTFAAEVWADNWFRLYANGEVVGEDSVPITTERSFNSETFTFQASYPLTIGAISKDFKESDSGLEYIGTDRQQMGDGGLIVQVTDIATGEVVATSSAGWNGLVVHKAPTNPECVSSSVPDTDCKAIILDEPKGWADPGFDDTGWEPATVYTAEAVGAKDGYDDITWAPTAALIWSSSLTQDNTILWRAPLATG